MLVNHPGIAPGFLDDTADPRAREAMRCEFRAGGAQDLLAALFGGAARVPRRRCGSLAARG